MNPNKISNLSTTNTPTSTEKFERITNPITNLHVELDRSFKSNLNTPLHMHTEFQPSRSTHQNLVESKPVQGESVAIKTLESLTPVDFLICSTGVIFILTSIYLVLSVMYPNIFPIPEYINTIDIQPNEFKQEILVQSGILAAMGTLFLSGMQGLRKVRLSKFDRNS